jgi:hypothetical protein
MHRLRRTLWTLGCLALGIALATIPVAGRTPWQHAQRAWQTTGARSMADSQVDNAKGAVEDAIDRVKDRLQGRHVPRERHSATDRQALSRLVMEKSEKSRPAGHAAP